MNGLKGKVSILVVSRHDRCEDRHPGHLGGTTEAALGVWRQIAQETAAEGVWYTPLGLHTALDMLYMKKRSQKSNPKVSMHSSFFGNIYVIGTAVCWSLLTVIQ